MVNKVNPPPHVPLPQEIAQNPNMRAWAQAINRILFQLWKRTGGGDDAVSDALINALASGATDARIAVLNRKIDELEARMAAQTHRRTRDEDALKLACRK